MYLESKLSVHCGVFGIVVLCVYCVHQRLVLHNGHNVYCVIPYESYIIVY